jgi:hypothetical protein
MKWSDAGRGGGGQVAYNIGLCICLFDILKVSEGMVGHGSGAAHVNGFFFFFLLSFFLPTSLSLSLSLDPSIWDADGGVGIS